MPKTYTVEEIADYISGWTMGEYDEVEEMGQYILKNALTQLRNDQDGIEAVRERKKNQQ